MDLRLRSEPRDLAGHSVIIRTVPPEQPCQAGEASQIGRRVYGECRYDLLAGKEVAPQEVLELIGDRYAGEGQGEPLHAPLREEHATQPHTEKQQDECQSGESDLLDDDRPEIAGEFGIGVLWADTHHRRIDHGV